MAALNGKVSSEMARNHVAVCRRLPGRRQQRQGRDDARQSGDPVRLAQLRRHLEQAGLLPRGMERGAFPRREIAVDPGADLRGPVALQPVTAGETSQLLDRIVPAGDQQRGGSAAMAARMIASASAETALWPPASMTGLSGAQQERIHRGWKTVEIRA